MSTPDYTKYPCSKCKKHGHWAKDCQEPEDPAVKEERLKRYIERSTVTACMRCSDLECLLKEMEGKEEAAYVLRIRGLLKDLLGAHNHRRMHKNCTLVPYEDYSLKRTRDGIETTKTEA